MTNQTTLEGRLDAVAAAKPWTAGAIPAVRAALAGDEAGIFRVNPIRFAATHGLEPAEAVALFLHLVKHRVFDMSWNLICPACGDTVQSFDSLKLVNSNFHCNLCDLDTEASLDDYVQVSFCVSPEVRDVRLRHPEKLTIGEYLSFHRFTTPGRYPDGRTLQETFAPLVRHLAYLEPGATATMELDAAIGELQIFDVLQSTGLSVEVAPATPVAGRATTQTHAFTFKFDGRTSVSTPGVETAGLPAAGRLRLTIANPTTWRRGLMVMLFPADMANTAVKFDPFLTGREVVATQTFRDLFRSETVGRAEPLGIRDLTFLFTDLKGSTELYGRIGDLKAFSLVRNHFATLGDEIQRHGGSLVKTIGDAVMANFLSPADAVAAALAMLSRIDAFNRSEGRDELILKIGVHQGAAIAVTLNEQLDYFGQTVNIAARVQGLAGAKQICMTEEIYRFTGVQQALAGCSVELAKAELKGVDGERTVYSARPPAAATRKRAAA